MIKILRLGAIISLLMVGLASVAYSAGLIAETGFIPTVEKDQVFSGATDTFLLDKKSITDDNRMFTKLRIIDNYDYFRMYRT